MRSDFITGPCTPRYGMRLWGACLLFGAAAFITACSSGSPRRTSDAEELQRYSQYAGEPISSFSLLGGLYNWSSLGKDKVAVWTTSSQAYLLTVQLPCNELPFAQRIGVTSAGSTVSKGLDFVKVGHQKCPIAEIRPIDYRRMQQDAKQQKQQQ
ncbi:MAG TPA: DUF6491 family protein [Steroidobacteraceae bacterium]|jgi:hypothetical protein